MSVPEHMYVCVSVCVHVHMCVFICVHVTVFLSVYYIFMHMSVSVCLLCACMQVYACVYACVCTYICIYAHMWLYVRAHVCVLCVLVCGCVWVCVCMYAHLCACLTLPPPLEQYVLTLSISWGPGTYQATIKVGCVLGVAQW